MQNLLFPFRSRSVNRHKPVPVLLTPQSIRTSHAADTSVGTDASKEIYSKNMATDTGKFINGDACAVYSDTVQLVRKKAKLKDEIAFAPFVWIGLILTMALGI